MYENDPFGKLDICDDETAVAVGYPCGRVNTPVDVVASTCNLYVGFVDAELYRDINASFDPGSYHDPRTVPESVTIDPDPLI